MTKGYSAHSRKLENGKHVPVIRHSFQSPSFPDGVTVDRVIAANGRIVAATNKPEEHDTALQAVNVARRTMRDPDFIDMIG
jgi:hypothetical protein